MKTKPDDYTTVQKAIDILLAFMPGNQEMGNLELSEKLGLHKSTVSRMLRVLTYYELLEQDTNTKKYRLGKTTADLGRAVNQSLSDQLVNIAKPLLDELRDTVGESAGLEMLSGDSTFFAYEAPGPNPLRVTFRHGEKLPFHVAAGTKAILAFSPPELINSLVKGRLPRFTPNTITRPTLLKKQLEEIRNHGIAFDRGEFHVDAHAMAVPVFNNHNHPIAAVAIAAPSTRFEVIIKNGAIEHLKRTAEKLSAKLYYSKPD